MVNLGQPLNLDRMTLLGESSSTSKASSNKKSSAAANDTNKIDASSTKDSNKINSKAPATNKNEKIHDSFEEKLERANVNSNTVNVDSRANESNVDRTIQTQRKEGTARVSQLNIDQATPATKEAAMTAFLNQMQAELGVAPNQVLEAFSQMSADDLLNAPEVSADKFIALLNLNPEKSDKAHELYGEMLAVTAAIGMQQSMTAQSRSASLKVIDHNDLSKQKVLKSLDDMNGRFFMNNNPAAANNKEIGNLQKQNMQPNNNVQSTEKFIMPAIAPALTPEQALAQDAATQAAPMTSASVEPKTLGKLNIEGFTPVQNDEYTEPLINQNLNTQKNMQEAATSKSEIADSSLNANSASATAPVVPPGLTAHTAGVEYASPEAISFGQVTNQSISAAAAEGSESGLDGDEGNSEGQLDQSTLSGIENGKAKSLENSNQAKDFAVQTSASNTDVHANVKEIISKAQFLADKGGGEMKVQLHPEGMGEINLKVKMNNGQVNVEMIAESDEARKALEKGLGELKENLALHKINLDSVRIESGKDISNQLDNQRREMENSFQQKFLSDFRERNNGTRREMFEFGAPNVPKSQLSDTVSASYGANKKRKAMEGRRLDLVA